MNVKLLRKVKKHILENPKRLFMGRWIKRKSETPYLSFGEGKKRPFPPCGTAACIAGWTCILSKHQISDNQSTGELATNLLDINELQASRLFGPHAWPSKYQAGIKDNGTKKTAKIAAARIEHFIKTKGAE